MFHFLKCSCWCLSNISESFGMWTAAPRRPQLCSWCWALWICGFLKTAALCAFASLSLFPPSSLAADQVPGSHVPSVRGLAPHSQVWRFESLMSSQALGSESACTPSRSARLKGIKFISCNFTAMFLLRQVGQVASQWKIAFPKPL